MDSARPMRHVAPGIRLFYGEQCFDDLKGELSRQGLVRAAIFSGRSLARDPAGVALLREALGDVVCGVFDGVAAHSPLPSVLAGAEALRDMRADVVIALGGGSAIVTARASAIMLAEGRPLDELATRFEAGKPPTGPRLKAPKLPQIAVPTTPTTAFAKAGTAVLDPAAGIRRTMADPQTRATAAFIHPDLIGRTPAALVRDASLNAFAMAIQGLESRQSDPIADAYLLEAIRLIRDHLPAVGAEGGEGPGGRGQLMIAAFLSGRGTDHRSCGLASALGHCFGGRFGLSNGAINAIMLPHTLRFNAPATQGRLEALRELLGEGDPAEACARFFGKLDLPRRLRDVGVERAALPQIAEDAFGDFFLYQNPRRVSAPAELVELLESAW